MRLRRWCGFMAATSASPGRATGARGRAAPSIRARRRGPGFPLDLGPQRRRLVALLEVEEVANDIEHRKVRDRTTVRDTATRQPARALPGLLPELEQEPGLSDSRIADHEHHLAVPGLDLLESISQQVEIALPADERGDAALEGGGQPVAPPSRSLDAPGLHRELQLALDTQLA